MTDRYAIVSRDWQRGCSRYAVIDTSRSADLTPPPIIETHDFARAIQVRDEMNAKQSA